MRSVTHFLRYSNLKCTETLTVRSAIVNSSVFPSEANRETEKTLSLSCGRFHSLPVAFRNSKSRRHSEIKQTRPSTKQDSVFRGSIVKTKHRGLTSLTFMQLGPGDDRVHAARPGHRPSCPPYLHSVCGPNGPPYLPFRANRASFYFFMPPVKLYCTSVKTSAKNPCSDIGKTNLIIIKRLHHRGSIDHP